MGCMEISLLSCLQIVKRAMGPRREEEQQKLAAEEEKGKRIKSVERGKKKEVLIFYEREDLLPRLRTISY